eukprot:scaffold69673_cov27-Phaeocystis_antarctica.AAC.1
MCSKGKGPAHRRLFVVRIRTLLTCSLCVFLPEIYLQGNPSKSGFGQNLGAPAWKAAAGGMSGSKRNHEDLSDMMALLEAACQ